MGKRTTKVLDKAIKTADADMKSLKGDYAKLKNIASQVGNLDISNGTKQKIVSAIQSAMREVEVRIDNEYRKMRV